MASIEEGLVLQQVMAIRNNHRRMGGRKLYELLEPFMLEHQIKMGRDALFELLSAHGLLVRKKRRKVYTTQSRHWLQKHKNLIKGFIPQGPNELWVSDITYLHTLKGFLYISLITDAYSHKIVGYHVAESLESMQTLEALKMALLHNKTAGKGLVHHSDRGVQYCSGEYVKLLKDNDISISMTENGDPLENAVAERINGIIKQEYMDYYQLTSLAQAKGHLEKAVYLYNNERPHLSLGMLTPENVHINHLKTENMWKRPLKVIADPHSASPLEKALHEGGITF